MASTDTPRLNRLERFFIFGPLTVLGVAVLLLLIDEAYRHLIPNAGRSKVPDSAIYSDLLVLPPDHPRHLANFTLVDQMSRPITRLDLAHKIVVVNFIFTNCSFICPRINAQMAKIQEQTAQDPRVRLLSLSVDPVDDTVSVLARYGHKYTHDADKWAFVTGENAPMQKLIEESFLVPEKQGEYASMPGNFVNAQRIVIVDQNGAVIEYVDGLNENASAEVIKKISELK